MRIHSQVTTDVQEKASLMALGMLPPEEASAFETHAAECPICESELRHFREMTAQLGLACPAVTPHPRVREKLLSKIHGSGDRLPEGISVLRAGEGRWQRTPFPGVTFKNLYVDSDTNYFTSLLRMEPGAKYPGHRHSGTEQCLVLEGDVRLGNIILRAGDYERANAGTLHGAIETDSGCLLLIIASRHDELLDMHV